MATSGVEVVIGITQDWLFGPVIMFGFGGPTGDLMDDRAHRLLLLTDLDADRLITRVPVDPAQSSRLPRACWLMVQRNVLYTASDPSETHVVPVGSKEAIGQAVRVAPTLGGATPPGRP